MARSKFSPPALDRKYHLWYIPLDGFEQGWPIGMPVCRPLGQGLHEVRTTLDNRIARVLFGIAGDEMVLLHGFIKKSQKTPKAELELARNRWKKYRSAS